MTEVVEELWKLALEDAQQNDLGKKTIDLSALDSWISVRQIEGLAKNCNLDALLLGGRSKRFNKLTKLAQTVHRHAQTFDVFVQQQPVIATIVWGTCRLLVQVAVDCHELSEKIEAVLTQIFSQFPRYQCEATLFATHARVRHSIRALFESVIVIVARSRAYFGQRKYVRLLKAAVSSNTFDASLKAVEDCVTQLDRELRTAGFQAQKDEFEIQNGFRRECSSRLSKIERNTLIQSQVLARTAHLKMLSEPGSLIPSHPHRSLLRDDIPQQFSAWLRPGTVEEDPIPVHESGTCEWIYSHQVWKDWEAHGFAETLFLSGVLGVGKTVTAKSICNRFRDQQSPITLSYFFSASLGEAFTTAKSLAIAVLWQLCQHQDILESDGLRAILGRFPSIFSTYPAVRECRFKTLLDILDHILNFIEPFSLIVDALDECSSDSDHLAKFLLNVGSRPNARVIVTSRTFIPFPRYDVKAAHICLSQSLMEPDIRHFIEREIHREERLYSQREKIIDTVIERSQGVFLHAKLLIEDLKTAPNIKKQKEKMMSFSPKFVAEYQRLFHDNGAVLTTDERLRRDDILRLLVAAKEPLTSASISQFLALKDAECLIDEHELDFEPAKEIMRLCAPLVQVSNSGRVHFFHGSAKEFLLSHQLTSDESDQLLARKCLGVLSQSTYRDPAFAVSLLRKHILRGTGYDADDTTLPDESEIYTYAVLYFQEHVAVLRDLPDDFVALLARFLQGTEFVTWSETLFELCREAGFGRHIAVYNRLTQWRKFLPGPVQAEIPLDDFFEGPHLHLSQLLRDKFTDQLLQYLPRVRIGDYFNAGGQSTDDWQKAYDVKQMVVTGTAELLGSEDPIVLKFRASLLQEYFWQKRFAEGMRELLILTESLRRIVGEDDPDLYNALWLLGLTHFCQSKFEDADHIYRESANGLKRLCGRSSRAYLVVQLYEGHRLEQLHQFDEAIELYAIICKELGPVVGPINSFILMAQTAMGAVQRKQGKYQEAKLNLFEGWAGRKQIFSININVCLDAAIQLALLYRDKGEGKSCLELLDQVSDSTVLERDFERSCQMAHLRALVGFDNGEYNTPKLALLRLLDEASGPNRDKNNRELLWIRITLANVMRHHGDEDEALMLFTDLVKPVSGSADGLDGEPEPPSQLRIAEQALRLVRQACLTESQTLLRDNGLQWLRDEDFWILGQGGPVTDTAVIAPIRH